MINIYVDGSYNAKTKESGWAYLIIYEPIGMFQKGSGKLFDEFGSRNVTGELAAVTYAFDYINQYSSGYLPPKINIHYDYLGIEMGALGKWKANKKLTKSYATMVQNAFKNLLMELYLLKLKLTLAINIMIWLIY